MRFSLYCNNASVVLHLRLGLIAALMLCPQELVARPCAPADPEGVNPGNLCLVYPTHGMTLKSDSFRTGYASDGYYGAATGPSQPGVPIQPGHQPGTPLDVSPSSRSHGFWTGIESSNGTTEVRTNSGKQWRLQIPRQ